MSSNQATDATDKSAEKFTVLKYETQSFSTMSTTYSTAIREINAVKTSLNVKVEKLITKDWNTVAGKAFYKKYTEEWIVALEAYILNLQTMQDTIKNAKTHYEEINLRAKEVTYRDISDT